MPFSSKFDQLWGQIQVAAQAAGAEAERVDKQLYEKEDVLSQIIGQIEDADAIVAVMTGKSPNVFFEVGIAHALRKHVVLLTANTSDVPFDVSHLKHVPYKTSFLRPNSLLDPNEFTTTLTNELEFVLSNPRVTDSYYQEYKKAMSTVESASCGLAPYFTPIATECFNQWSNFVKLLGTEGGAKTKGPLRLAITRALVHGTQRYRVVERFLGIPEHLNSNDWISFYDEIGNDKSVETIWILCVDEADVTRQVDEVEASWQFRKKRNFDTRYCSPRELQRAGQQFGGYDVIEDFGESAKFLWLKGMAYTEQEEPNCFPTRITMADENHKRLMETLIHCSQEIDERWMQRLRSDKHITVKPAVSENPSMAYKRRLEFRSSHQVRSRH